MIEFLARAIVATVLAGCLIALVIWLGPQIIDSIGPEAADLN